MESQSDPHLDNLLIATNIELPWYKSIFKNIGEALNPPKLPPLELTSRPLEGSELGDIAELEQPWYKSLIGNIKDIINPPKLPPLQITSKAVEVPEIWGAYGGGQGRSGVMSVLIHAGVVLLLLFAFQTQVVQKHMKQMTDLVYVKLPEPKVKLPKAAEKAGGGGGQHDLKPASHGEAPKFAKKQFIAPTIPIQQPKLPVVPTINADIPKIESDTYGQQNSLLTDSSLGNGTGTGIGSGNGNGYGPGSGGGAGGGTYKIGGEVSSPTILSKTEPEYSEEARKAKYSGSVLLSIVVDENGIPRNIRVVRPLGLGLDEKAIEAVAKWRFRPGMKGGKAVRVEAQVEVSFRLL